MNENLLRSVLCFHNFFTDMEKQNEELFVLTWNLLAPIFVRPNDDQQDFAYFGHCSLAELDWETRKAGIQARLREIDADVVLMQG